MTNATDALDTLGVSASQAPEALVSAANVTDSGPPEEFPILATVAPFLGDPTLNENQVAEVKTNTGEQVGQLDDAATTAGTVPEQAPPLDTETVESVETPP
ncbi:MAG: hypothetical protein ACYCO3_11730, partial [Mycobacteriales bacterium]